MLHSKAFLRIPKEELRHAMQHTLGVPHVDESHKKQASVLQIVDIIVEAIRTAGNTSSCLWDPSLSIRIPLPRYGAFYPATLFV